MRRAARISVLSIAAFFAISTLAALPNPKDANLSLTIARTLRISGLPQLAIPFYTYTMERAPKHAIVPRSRGLAYDAMGKHEAAIADYDLSEKLEPQVADTNYLRAQTYVKLGRHQDALSDFDAAVRKDPKDAKIRYHRATYLIKNKKPWQAISDLNALVAMHEPKSARYYLVSRAHVYEDLGIASRMWADHFASCKGPARQKCILKSTLYVKKRQKDREYWKKKIAEGEQLRVKFKKQDEELRDLKASIVKEPKELQFRIHRSSTLIESKEYWPAISDLSTVVAMRHPKWTRVALARRAQVYWLLGKAEKSWADTIAAKQFDCEGPLRNTCLISTKLKFARMRNDLKKFELSHTNLWKRFAKSLAGEK